MFSPGEVNRISVLLSAAAPVIQDDQDASLYTWNVLKVSSWGVYQLVQINHDHIQVKFLPIFVIFVFWNSIFQRKYVDIFFKL